MQSSTELLAFQPPHPLNKKEEACLKSLSEKKKELHKLATVMLGSSQFMGKTKDFMAWEAQQKVPSQ
jgi:hypothetical protein